MILVGRVKNFTLFLRKNLILDLGLYTSSKKGKKNCEAENFYPIPFTVYLTVLLCTRWMEMMLSQQSHKWIPQQKIADLYFFLNYLPVLSYVPLNESVIL